MDLVQMSWFCVDTRRGITMYQHMFRHASESMKETLSLLDSAGENIACAT